MKKVTIPKQAVVFGTDRIASIWALRNNVSRDSVILATHPEEVEEMTGPVKVVRVSDEEWQPTTFPDETRVKETEKVLKALKRGGQEVMEEILE